MPTAAIFAGMAATHSKGFIPPKAVTQGEMKWQNGICHTSYLHCKMTPNIRPIFIQVKCGKGTSRHHPQNPHK